MPTTKSDECTRHEVREVVCDYGVYAKYLCPEPHEELLVICNSRKNAELIKMILDYDSVAQTCNELVVDEILDNANGNILGYVDERYRPKMMAFDGDGIRSFTVIITGFGRFSKLDECEISAIKKMKATEEVVIKRKLGPITLWSITV